MAVQLGLEVVEGGGISVSVGLALAVSCGSILTIVLLVLCSCVKKNARRAKTSTRSDERSVNTEILVSKDIATSRRGIYFDDYQDDVGHYDLIGPDAPVVKSASRSVRGPVVKSPGRKGYDAGYETLPVDEESVCDLTYSTINERPSKSKSGVTTDGYALYSLIDDVIPNNESRKLQSLQTTESHNNSIVKPDQPPSDQFPIYSVVNKSPAGHAGTSEFISSEPTSCNNDGKKKKRKKGECREDGSVDNTTPGAAAIPIYSLVTRTNPSRIPNAPGLPAESENNETNGGRIDQPKVEVCTIFTVDGQKQKNKTKNKSETVERSNEDVEKVPKQSHKISNKDKDNSLRDCQSADCKSDTFSEDCGYETLPEITSDRCRSTRESVPQNISYTDSASHDVTDSQTDKSLPLPGERNKNKKGGRRRGKSDEEVTPRSRVTSGGSVRRCDSWTKCDLIALPYNLTSDAPLYYSTAV